MEDLVFAKTINERLAEWPNAEERELYFRAGLGDYSDGKFLFHYQNPPQLIDALAYLELENRDLVSDEGLPKNPRTGFVAYGISR
jgi:hypothetical protein